MAYMTLLGLAGVVFGRPRRDLFSDEADVIDLGVWMMRLAAMYQLFDAVAISYGNALRGAGDTLWPAIVTSFLSWLITVVGASLVASLHPEWGSLGPWTVATLDIVLCGVILAARWRWGPWEKLDIIGRTKSDRPENEFQPESD